jgi:hypothetical protein
VREKLGQFMSKISASFDTSNKGFSARKLTAFVTMFMVIVIDIKWLRSEQWIYISEILALHFMFILTLLGLATWQAVKEKSNEKHTDTNTEP